MKTYKFDRLYSAVLTPYKANYAVDETAFRKLLKYFMQAKFRNAGGGIIVNPGAGEVEYLTRKEKRRNAEMAMEEVQGRVPVFSGINGLTPEDTIKEALDAKEVGVDGIFIFPPIGSTTVSVFWEPNQYPEVWLDIVKKIDKAVNMPIIVHPVMQRPSLHGVGLPVEPTLQMCREITNIVGWKMTYSWEGYLAVSKALRSLDRHVGILYSGSALPGVLAVGVYDGNVSGRWNSILEPMLDYILAFKRGDIKEAQKIWNSGFGDIMAYIPAGGGRQYVMYKLASWIRGIIPSPILRPPLPKPRKEEAMTIYNVLAKMGLEVIDKKEVNAFFARLNK
jgi:4-hydroxy-tetrahydrodipicolinate synthase